MLELAATRAYAQVLRLSGARGDACSCTKEKYGFRWAYTVCQLLNCGQLAPPGWFARDGHEFDLAVSVAQRSYSICPASAPRAYQDGC